MNNPAETFADELDTKHPGMMEQICEEIAEQLWDRDRSSKLEEGEDGYVWIADIQAINQANHVLVGVFWLGGVEYSFEAESGDNNGWMWRSISADEPIPSIEIQHTKWALEPNSALVDKALRAGQGEFLVAKWDALSGREPYKSLPGKYAYDRFFQPGILIETHYRDLAAKVGFVLVDQQAADETRVRLLS